MVPVGRVILEAIVTTVDSDGNVNIAPMGPTVLSPDLETGRPRFKLRPWQGSQTCANLLATGDAVIHVTDDARLIAQAAVGKVSAEGRVCPIPRTDGESIRHYRLLDCHRWYAVSVDRRADVESQRFPNKMPGSERVTEQAVDQAAEAVRHELIAEAVAEGVVRPFFGFNRAKHAVIETAILATRLHVLPAAEVWRELQRWEVSVQKTAGADEREAFAMLREHIERRISDQPGPSAVSAHGRVAGAEGTVTVGEAKRAEERASGVHAGRQADATVFEIQTGARLHFGLLDVRSPFGGCGVIVDWPATTVRFEPSPTFRCSGGHEKRLHPIARRVAAHFGLAEMPPVSVTIRSAAPAHSGLGSGTQLSMAVAEGLLRAASLSDRQGEVETTERRIVQLADRGHRSAVGAIGYFRGGWVTEGTPGHDRVPSDDVLGRLDRRLSVPSAWRVGILLPHAAATAGASPVSGTDEQRRFDSLPEAPREQRDQLVSLLWDQLMPAIERVDFSSFGDCLTRYNRLSGQLFADAQGGPYHGEATTRLIETLLDRGHRGVGQSSWGPGVFVWFESAEHAEAFGRWHEADRLSRSWSYQWTQPRHRPRTLVRLSD